MEGWKEIRLKELISEMGDGGTPSTLTEGNFGGKIPWVVVDDVKPEIYSTKDTLTEQGFKCCSAKMWNAGTIILTTGATIGKVGIAKVPLCTKQGITGIVCNEYANNLFIRYWLEANEEQLLRYAQGTTFKEIRTRPLGNLKILIPNPFTKESVAEQTAIAAILSKVDEAITSLQASIAAAERLKKSLMQNLLTGRMKPDGTLRKEDEFYLDEKFGRVPVGWEVKKVTEVADYVQYGLNQASSEKGKIPMLRMNNIVKGKMTNAPLVYVELNDSLLQQYKLEKGDILFNRTNSLDLVGKVGVFELDGDYVFASYLIKVKVSKDNNPYFVNYALNSYPIQCSLRSKATPAVSQANINSKSLRNTSIIIPTNKKEQDEIVSRINNVENEIINKQNKTAIFERLKKSLMQNLLTGRVRIKCTINNLNK